MIRKFFRWIFKEELADLKNKISAAEYSLKCVNEKNDKLTNILDNIDVSVDVHQYSKSWAAISIQGQKADYIKFVDLGQSEIREIQNFLRHFDRRKIDATPQATKYLKVT